MLYSIEYLQKKQQKFLQELTRDNAFTTADDILICLINGVEKRYPGVGEEILKGGHILMEDSSIYDILVKNSPSIFRTSSHYKQEKIEERSFDLHSRAEFLAGKNNHGNAWLQMERHKQSFQDGFISGSLEYILHIFNYFQFLVNGRNVGPLGTSLYRDQNPIFLSKDDILNFLADNITLTGGSI